MIIQSGILKIKRQNINLNSQTLHNCDTAYYVVGYLEKAFPVQQMVLVAQEDGPASSVMVAQPLRDGQGRPVISREALALRDAALEEILLLAPVPSALDQIVWAFGPDMVAEVTGRSLRPVKDGSGCLRVERRSASANAAETAAFLGCV